MVRSTASDLPVVVGVGAIYLDIIRTVPHFPAEDGKLRATRSETRRGGNVPNTLEVLQQLLLRKLKAELRESYGAPRQFTGSSEGPPEETPVEGPRDEWNNFLHLQKRPILLASLPEYGCPATQSLIGSFRGVDLSHCFYRGAVQTAPESWILRSEATGSRTIVNYNELAEMEVGEFASAVDLLACEPQANWFHFEGRIPETTLSCLRKVHDLHQVGQSLPPGGIIPDMGISVELEKPNRPGLEALAAEANVVFHSRSWAEAKGYRSAGECLRGQAPLCPRAYYIFCTWGAQGAAACPVMQGGVVEPIESVEADNVATSSIVDTVGAGDTFIAGALYGLVYQAGKWDLKATLKFANQLAGRKVVQNGFAGLGEQMKEWID